jgi:uncharacterized protein (DUF1330 family)
MAKGYWIVLADVNDPEGYKQYISESGQVFRKFGARFLARGGKSEKVEGVSRSRFVVIEFKDHPTALECYRSSEYTKAREARKDRATFDVIVTEGYDGPQPTD